MKLYEFDVSRSTRVHWVLREVDVKYESIAVDLVKGEQRSPEFLAINPYGKLPVLVDDGITITESAAICTYIAEKYQSKGLIPPQLSAERAHYHQWICFCISEMEPYLWNIRKNMMLYPKADRSLKAVKIAKREYINAARILDSHLSNSEYILGDNFSAADIVVCYNLFWANTLKLLSEFPRLSEYMNLLQKRPAFPGFLFENSSKGLIY
ncbi:MAG: glutathione S-transferase [Gammaproteobacteria bacterium]|jgi:glutathione S-transferase